MAAILKWFCGLPGVLYLLLDTFGHNCVMVSPSDRVKWLDGTCLKSNWPAASLWCIPECTNCFYGTSLNKQQKKSGKNFHFNSTNNFLSHLCGRNLKNSPKTHPKMNLVKMEPEQRPSKCRNIRLWCTSVVDIWPLEAKKVSLTILSCYRRM